MPNKFNYGGNRSWHGKSNSSIVLVIGLLVHMGWQGKLGQVFLGYPNMNAWVKKMTKICPWQATWVNNTGGKKNVGSWSTQKKHETVLFCDSKLLKWSFAEMGVSLPLNHPYFNGMFHDRPTIWGTPIDGNPKYERLLFREGVLEAQWVHIKLLELSPRWKTDPIEAL